MAKKQVLPYVDKKSSKKSQVREMFDSISSRYDIINRIISGGLDIKWRKNLVKVLKPKKVVESLKPITPLLASANIESGEKIFKKCAACHSIQKGGDNRIGPALWNVVDRKVGSLDGFKYSAALKNYNKNWTYEELNGFLHKPLKYIKGTKMAFAGLRKEMDRANIIAYLNSMGDSPKSLK